MAQALEEKGRKAVAKKAKALQTLTVEYVAVNDLKPNSYNPNRQNDHDFELLRRSMEEDGFTQPIVVQGDTMEIVDGEHRWRAAASLGIDSIPVVKVDMTPEQMRISTLRHNRARGSEDFDLTAALFADLEKLGALDWAQDSLMIDDVELQRLLTDVAAPEALADPEFSDAWTPVEKDPLSMGGGAAQDTSMTPDAVQAVRDRERRYQEAKTEEERQAALKDRSVYRLALVFAAEEADIVKGVLEPRPAEKILELCQGATNA